VAADEPGGRRDVQQVWITRKGGPEVLELREAPDPTPGPGQVRVRVQACGVNFADLMMRLGFYPDAPRLPAVPGYEVAGRVDALGEGVSERLDGADVVALCNFGGYASAVCVPASQVWPRPADVAVATGAALPVNYLTAYQMLRVMARAIPGESVLVHSAAGGVGQAALQIARQQGATILASASPAKHDHLREQGVVHVFDSRRERFAADVRAATEGRGCDIVLEPRNGRWIMESYRSLAHCGRLVLFGFAAAASGPRSGTWSVLRTLAQVPWFRLHPLRLMNDNRSIAGVNLGRMWGEGERLRLWMRELLDGLVRGDYAPRVDRVFGLDEAAAAHRYLHERRNVGKVLLAPDPAAVEVPA
jgi:NADPH:quinone reductase-like Zn-dependent oxidoreductase